MSDEFEIPEEDEDQSDDLLINEDDNDDDDDDDGDNGGDDEGSEQTPESSYADAKDNEDLGNYADSITAFMQLFNTVEDQNIKTKSIGHALSIMAQEGDLERTISTLDTYITMGNNGEVSGKRFEKRINDVLDRALRSEALYTSVLNKCLEKIDISVFSFLLFDLKFRLLEVKLNAGLRPEAEKIASDLEERIPINVKHEDPTLAKYAQKLIITNIELALARQDEEKATRYYSLISGDELSETTSPRITGIMKETKGLELIHSGNYQEAKNLLREAFTEFNNVGYDRRVAVLPYYTMAFMLSKERDVDPYRAPEIAVLEANPLVAPMRQLFDAYINNNIVKFLEKFESAQKTFNNDFYTEKLNVIRHDVLTHSIFNFVKPYSTVKISYIASQLKSEENEVRECIIDLISADQFIEEEEKKFGMLIDDLEDTLVKFTAPKVSEVLSPYVAVLDVLQELVLKN